MAEWYRCFTCSKVYPLLSEESKQMAQEGKCSTCGGSNGQILSHERFNEGFEAGAIYNIDPITGKPAKKRKR